MSPLLSLKALSCKTFVRKSHLSMFTRAHSLVKRNLVAVSGYKARLKGKDVERHAW